MSVTHRQLGIQRLTDDKPRRSPSGTRVINIRTHGQPDVYIGRPSMWGNPFKIGRDGTREQVIEKYRDHVIGEPRLMALLPTLRGKTLGCYCKPLACHGDVLVELVDALPEPEAQS